MRCGQAHYSWVWKDTLLVGLGGANAALRPLQAALGSEWCWCTLVVFQHLCQMMGGCRETTYCRLLVLHRGFQSAFLLQPQTPASKLNLREKGGEPAWEAGTACGLWQ